MLATVWTAHHIRPAPEYEDRRPKCIFSGVIVTIPREGERVVVRSGFCAETVHHVTHDLVNGEVEIGIVSADPEDEYGPCLLRVKK